jgi:hypothetical protein
VENLKIIDFLAAVIQEALDIHQKIFKVVLFLFFFLTFVHSFSFGDVFNFTELSFIVEFVPFHNLSDSANGRELEVIDVSVMPDSDERFMNVGVGESTNIFLFFEFLVQDKNFRVYQDSGDHSEWHVVFNVFDCLIVAIHANISKQVDIGEQVIEFIGISLEKFRKSARVFSSAEDDLHNFVSLFLSNIIQIVFNFRNAILHLKLKGEIPSVQIFIFVAIVEEIVQKDLLIVLEDDIVSFDKCREQSQVFSCEIAISLLSGFFEEELNELIDDFNSDHSLD